ncbi:DEAD/DEAH box helicase [Pirellulaceae bacterium SH467]
MASAIGKIAKNGETRSPAKVNVFHQRLGRLTVHQATQLLGADGKRLLMEGGHIEIDPYQDIYLGGDLYRVRIPGGPVVTVTLQSTRDKQLQLNCTECIHRCEHMGAALSHLLESKTDLGLAAPPDESVALELLTESELLVRALAERQKRAEEESMTVRASRSDTPWTDYLVTSSRSGKTYRVALRGSDLGQSYCSCPDYRTNHLGTCKHILHALQKIQRKFSAALLRKPYVRKNLSVRVRYQHPAGLLFNLPEKLPQKLKNCLGDADRTPLNGIEMMERIQALEQLGTRVNIYPDAEEWIQRELVQQHLLQVANKIRKSPSTHPLRKSLLSVELLPYQLDGIAFALGAGRAILADDMGLGKTIQGIGLAELLAREAEIKKVLVICPASLKSQWQSEIQRFCGRSSQLVMGTGSERAKQYSQNVFFTICNYEQVVRDLNHVENGSWDLIILDEGQRIKNWESKVSQTVRSLNSPFALVLSGTPLENRLDDLYTIVKFVDDTRLGPAYRFFHTHREVDDRGKAIGYKRLDELRTALKPILLRRTRDEVSKQLPDRIDEVVRIRPTEEQLDISNAQLSIASRIAAKKFLTEMDLLRLQKALLLARMAADSTYLIDEQEPEFSSKLVRLGEMLEQLIADPTRKIVMFSEWTRMLDRIELKLESLGCDFVRLDGSVPQKKRPAIVSKFQNDPKCRLILMTNAGSTGLNLQSANTVINVDLPWNPAVLEQRIARAHRMGQKNPVHIYNLVTEDTIEERLLETLANKQELANAAIDFSSETDAITMKSSIANIREKLEKILVPVPEAPIDASQERRVALQTQEIEQRREKVSAAGGQLLSAALQLVGELVSPADRSAPDDAVVDQLASSLNQCVERDESGRPKLTIQLENDEALRSLAQTLARLLVPATDR